MSKVRLISWSPGLNTVVFIKLIRDAAKLPLNEALDAVNRFLAGEAVDVTVQDEKGAQRLVDDARALGVRIECVEIEISATK